MIIVGVFILPKNILLQIFTNFFKIGIDKRCLL